MDSDAVLVTLDSIMILLTLRWSDGRVVHGLVHLVSLSEFVFV